MEWKKDIWEEEFKKEYFQTLKTWVTQRRKERRVVPEGNQVFRAFNETPFDNIKVVIVGQDPYTSDDACGLAFSSEKKEIPASLRNIFKEIKSDIGLTDYEFVSPDLSSWAKQGVLLMNRILTTDYQGEPNSHEGKGWETFTDQMIRTISANRKNVVYILWGQKAQSVEGFIQNPENNLILKAPHPSPLSADKGFFGCKHFSKCNEYLVNMQFKLVKSLFLQILKENEENIKKSYELCGVKIEPYDYLFEVLSREFARFPATVNKTLIDDTIINFKNNS